jgi:hypothetical protein
VPFSEGKPDLIFCNKIIKSYMHVHNRCKWLKIQRENSNNFLSTCTHICLRILAIYISLLAKFLMVGANSITISQLAYKHCLSLAITIPQLGVTYGRVCLMIISLSVYMSFGLYVRSQLASKEDFDLISLSLCIFMISQSERIKVSGFL